MSSVKMFNKNKCLPHPKTVLISVGSYHPAHPMLPLSLLPAQLLLHLAVLLRPQQLIGLDPHGDHGAMLRGGVAPQLCPMCVVHLHPPVVATTGLAVEIDPVLGRCPPLARVVVIHEAALAIHEPFMHAAPEILVIEDDPGHEIFTDAEVLLMWVDMWWAVNCDGLPGSPVACVCVLTSWRVLLALPVL